MDAKVVCKERGDDQRRALDPAVVEADHADEKLILAGAAVRKLRRAARIAEDAATETVKLPAAKYAALLREAEQVIRDLYGRVKAAEAKAREIEETQIEAHRWQISVTEFPRRLRIARKAAGLTQQQLAGRARLSYATIYQMERGVRTPKWRRVEELAKALGCSAEWLAGTEER